MYWAPRSTVQLASKGLLLVAIRPPVESYLRYVILRFRLKRKPVPLALSQMASSTPWIPVDLFRSAAVTAAVNPLPTSNILGIWPVESQTARYFP